LAGGLNLYGYAGGDPVNFSDPFGLSPCLAGPVALRVCAAAITSVGGAIGAAVARVASNVSGNRPLGEGVAEAAAEGGRDGAAWALAGGAASALASRSAGAAGVATEVTGAAETAGATGRITGFTRHGIDRVIERGVKPGNILQAVKNADPVRLVDKAGRVSYRYSGENATVVLNDAGKIVTAW
jgi:hypothetical protein